MIGEDFDERDRVERIANQEVEDRGDAPGRQSRAGTAHRISCASLVNPSKRCIGAPWLQSALAGCGNRSRSQHRNISPQFATDRTIFIAGAESSQRLRDRLADPPISDGIPGARHKGMLFGIDCASVDKNVNPDWAAAKARGPISFALIRATWGAEPDTMFAREWPALKAAGLTRGAYMYLRFPRNGKPAPASPQQQANAFLEVVGKLDRSDLPGTIDVEFPGDGRCETGLTAQQALDWVRAARDVVAAQGAPPIIYTSARVWQEDLDNLDAPDLVDSPLWLARYYFKERLPARQDAALFTDGHHNPPVPRPWGDADNWWIHQYQGDALDMPAMSSTVDMNRFNVLGEGARGARVRWVQRRLGIAASGMFDADMARAVIAYQRKCGLVPDCIIGPRTFARLCWERVR